jgi:hypothetical protein
LNIQAIKALFVSAFRSDAQALFEKMRTPTYLRLRAETEGKDVLHPLLAMRLDNLDPHVNKLKQMRIDIIIEGDLQIETVEMAKQVARDVERAIESCLRVLECSDSPEVKAKVADAAKSMSMSLDGIARTFEVRKHVLAEEMAKEALTAFNLSNDVDLIAAQLRVAYENTSISYMRLGEAPPQQVPEEKMAASR